MIPPRIIQTGRDRHLNSVAQASAVNLKLLHPDWEYLFFDDVEVERFVADEFPQYLGIFKSFPVPIQRIDFFRYLAVYRLGGFYFDLDVILFKSLSTLCNYTAVFPFEELTMNLFLHRDLGLRWEIGNYGFGAEAGNEFLARIITNCVKAQKDPGWVVPMMEGIPRALRADFEVLNTTGPGLISRTLAEVELGIRDRVTVLPPDDIYQISKWHHFGTYGVHLMEGSWHGQSRSWRRKLAWWKLMRSVNRRNPRSALANEGLPSLSPVEFRPENRSAGAAIPD